MPSPERLCRMPNVARRALVMIACTVLLAVAPTAANAADASFIGYKRAADGLPFATWCYAYNDAANSYWYSSGFGWFCKGAQTYRFDPNTPSNAADDEFYMRRGNFMYDADRQGQATSFFPADGASGKWSRYR